jgi:predicted site-specific integrase-resolvase
MNKNLPIYDRVLSPKQAAALAFVTLKELRRWEREGKVRALKTATGAHRRYLESEVMAAAGRRKTSVLEPREDRA